MGKSAGSPPASPDYEKLIPLQTKANLEQFNTMLNASRATSNTPYGSSSWVQDGNGGWTNNQTLSPEQQDLYNKNVSSQQQQAGLLSGLGTTAAESVAKPIDFSGAPALTGSLSPSSFQTGGSPNIYGNRADNLSTSGRQYGQEAADAMYNSATRYLKPQQEQQTSQAEARLAEQGFVPGTPAYDQAMGQIRQTQDMALADARDRATTQGANVGNQWYSQDLSTQSLGATSDNADYNRNRTNTLDANDVASKLFGQQQASATFGNQARNQAISELLTQRQQPLNELNAFRSGTQVTNPNTQAQYSTPNLQGVDQIGAANQDYQNQLGVYNSKVGSDNGILGMLSGLGGSLIQGGTGAGSALGGLGNVLGPMMAMFSDPRLKTNIVRIGTSPMGYPWYSFNWKHSGESSQGVMATEVPESITIRHPSGYLMVDYSKV